MSDYSPKIETVASESILNEIRQKITRVNNEILAQHNNPIKPNLINGSWVGVVKHNSTAGSSGCGGWDELEIYMDCEDNNPKTSWLPTDPYLGFLSPSYTYHPGSWVTNGNATLRFCIVPGNDFHPFNISSSGGYALLRVTTNFLGDAREVSRRFDNEDNNNGNSAVLRFGNLRTPLRNGQTLSVKNNASNSDNSVFRTFIDGNSYMSFHVFQNGQGGTAGTFMTGFPNFNGLAYGVIGGELVPQSLGIGLLRVDDQDGNNANFYFDDEFSTSQPDLWNIFKNMVEGRNGDLPSILPGNQTPHISGKDTYVYVARVK
ncbi:MAG: hypothetical protein ACKVOW_04850 [Chitinophagaceae bacterium]